MNDLGAARKDGIAPWSDANAALGVFNSYTQASKYALPEWRYHNYEWYVQDNWKMKKLRKSMRNSFIL